LRARDEKQKARVVARPGLDRAPREREKCFVVLPLRRFFSQTPTFVE